MIDELCQRDEQVLDAAELLLDSLGEYPSPRALRRVREALARGRAAVRAAEEGAASWESVCGAQLEQSWRVLECWVEARWNWPADPEPLLEALFGPGGWATIERQVADLDPVAVTEYFDLRQGLRRDRLPTADSEYFPRVRTALLELVEALIGWLAREGWDLPGLDVTVSVVPDESGHAYYQPRMGRIVVPSGLAMVFRRPSGIEVDASPALRTVCHELLGHAVQHALSADLPAFLQAADRTPLRLAGQVCAEGLGEHASEVARRLLASGSGILGTAARDRFEIEQRVGALFHALPALACVARLKEQIDPAFTAAGYLASVAGHDGFGTLLDTAAPDLDRIVYHASSAFGWQMVARADAELARHEPSPARRWRRLGRGAWTPALYPRVVTGSLPGPS
ncbi:MAG TPA: hypothetical protein ENK10_07650 [Acidobacteria bacterium]|nr:hypothetical protein [Acidobacteriota bacterium]